MFDYVSYRDNGQEEEESPADDPSEEEEESPPPQLVWTDVIPTQRFSDKKWGNYFVGGSNASPTSKRITIKDDERNKSYAKTRVLDGRQWRGRSIAWYSMAILADLGGA